LRHTQHIKALLSILTRLLDSHKLFQQGACLLELIIGEGLLGVLVLIAVVGRLVDLVELSGAAAQKQHRARTYYDIFLHIGVQSYDFSAK
jgi:hypothetical protein